MIVPDHWAEAKERVVVNGSATTYKRFGWSDRSQEAAYQNALERVQEAAGRARLGEKVRRIDRKVAYNGDDGLPIREQVVERHGDTVITRNAYGALCLNTPYVLFADVDVTPRSSHPLRMVFVYINVVLGLGFGFWTGAAQPVAIFLMIAIFGSGPLAKAIIRRFFDSRESQFERALQPIDEFALYHPDWLIRVYRTPNGYRLLVEHEVFDASDVRVYRFMEAVGTDKNYMNMCRHQKCFRARLTPKPWRVGMRRIKPRPGIWPVKKERMAERNSWISDYEFHSKDHAACRYEKTLGVGHSDWDCVRVRELHDDMSGANRSLPLA